MNKKTNKKKKNIKISSSSNMSNMIEEDKKIELTKEEIKDKVIIPDEIIKQIKEYNFASPTEEWSGVIFYNVQEEKGLFVFTIKGLIPLDVGNSTTTEYDITNPEIIHYMAINNLTDCYMGHLH